MSLCGKFAAAPQAVSYASAAQKTQHVEETARWREILKRNKPIQSPVERHHNGGLWDLLEAGRSVPC